MTIRLYDLCAEDPAVRFSPPCWLVKYALMHKGLEFEAVPLGFAEKENYPDPEYGRLPVIDDAGVVVRDSVAILAYLDEAYPAAPLAPGPGDAAAFEFVRAFAATHVFPPMASKLFVHVERAIRPTDRAYFRASREERLGMSLEAAAARDVDRQLAEALGVVAAPLAKQDFYGGERPAIADYFVASVFLWERCVTPAPVIEKPPALSDWFERMLDLFDGYARRAATV